MFSKGEMIFNPETHEYTLKGEKYISVTQLMKKHGLSTDYGSVSESVLKAVSDRGTMIHEEIADFIQQGERGFTSECADFIRLCKENNLLPFRAEYVVYDLDNKVAGTVDMLGQFANSVRKLFIADNKTTSTLNKEALSWQLSLYEYLGNTFNEDIDDSDITFVNAEKLYGFHLLPNGQSRLVEVERISRGEILKLLECEKNGELYQKPTLTLTETEIREVTKAQELVESIERQLKEAKEEKKKLEEVLLRIMKAHKVKKFESDAVVVTYVAPTKRSSIDVTQLQTDLPDICAKYKKESDVSESVRIKLRATNGNAS